MWAYVPEHALLQTGADLAGKVRGVGFNNIW